MQLSIAPLDAPTPGELPVEIVERKGIGHPDTICDALAENLTLALSRHYLECFGTILHHNVDKALLCGGAARCTFGGGELLEPIEIYLAGRATTRHHGIDVPVEAIAIEATRTWLAENLPTLDPVRDVRVYPKLRPTSADLAALFTRQREAAAPLANDTSFGVGFAPLDELEATVLAAERDLHLPAVREVHPEIGQDVKVMGVRSGGEVWLTVACAFIARHIRDFEDYRYKRGRVAKLIEKASRAVTPRPVKVAVNTGDGDTPESLYLTVTGLSAESGDDGQVGRGNRANGLITPYRPMSLEALAGKNPVSHVGKLYNVLAHRIAAALVTDVPGIEQAECYLVSQIGRSIDDPQLIDLKVRVTDARLLEAVRPRITEIARDHLAGVGSLWQALIAKPGAVPEYLEAWSPGRNGAK